MSKTNFKLRKISLSLANELDFIKAERIRRKVDNNMLSDARITDGMIKEPEFLQLKEKMILRKRKEDII